MLVTSILLAMVNAIIAIFAVLAMIGNNSINKTFKFTHWSTVFDLKISSMNEQADHLLFKKGLKKLYRNLEVLQSKRDVIKVKLTALLSIFSEK